MVSRTDTLWSTWKCHEILRHDLFSSDVEQEVHHVAIFDHVLFALGAHLARIFGPLFAFERNEIIKRDGLRADEAALEVTVDDASGLGGGGTDWRNPAAAGLVDTGGCGSSPANQIGGSRPNLRETALGPARPPD